MIVWLWAEEYFSVFHLIWTKTKKRKQTKYCAFRIWRKTKPDPCLEPVGTDMVVITTVSLLVLDLYWSIGKREWKLLLSTNDFAFVIDLTFSNTILDGRTKALEKILTAKKPTKFEVVIYTNVMFNLRLGSVNEKESFY